MAKRMKSKIQPSELKLAFTMDKGGYHYIDLSQAASIINRRFYRQGLNWAVSHFTFYKSSPTESGSSGVTVSKLPTSWIMSNAWEKGFRHWMKMNKEALESSESVKPKFLDFKIYMNHKHHLAGYADNLLPLDSTGLVNSPSTGEWVHSTFHIPNASVDQSDPSSNNPRSVIAIGANYQGAGADGNFAVSLIEGYAASRGLPAHVDPNTPDDAASVNGSLAQNWLAALDNDFDQQTGEVLNDMISENNQAPYPFENDGINTDTMYPGGANQLSATRVVGSAFFNAGTNANKVIVEGDTFPCGLIEILTTDDDVSLLVTLVPGSHRGYLAEPMTEM